MGGGLTPRGGRRCHGHRIGEPANRRRCGRCAFMATHGTAAIVATAIVGHDVLEKAVHGAEFRLVAVKGPR